MFQEKLLASYLEELSQSLGCVKFEICSSEAKKAAYNYKYELLNKYLVFHRPKSMSVNEKGFIDTSIKVYNRLIEHRSTISDRISLSYFDASVLSSVMNLSVAAYIGQEDCGVFHELITDFILLSYEKYEGEQAKTGIIYSGCDFRGKEAQSSELITFECVESYIDQEYSRKLLHDIGCYRYVDGVSSFFVTNSCADIQGYITVYSDRLNLFERLAGDRVNLLAKELGDFVFYIGITTCGDVEIIPENTMLRIVYRKGHWYVIDCSVLVHAIVGGALVNEDYYSLIWKVIYGLSRIRKGAAILVTAESESTLDAELVVGSISESLISQEMQLRMKDADVLNLADSGELQRILTTDGMCIVDNKFKTLLYANVIVDSSKGGGGSGGGRTTAVKAASKYGTAVKVSEDGPISVYRNGRKIYSVG